MQSFLDNLPAILTALTSVIGTASAVAAIFGKSDNKYIEYARKAVAFLALNFGHATNAANVTPANPDSTAPKV